MTPNPRAMIAALTILAGTSPDWLDDQIKIRPVRDRCVVCDRQIPPGKPGRDCLECRSKGGAE